MSPYAGKPSEGSAVKTGHKSRRRRGGEIDCCSAAETQAAAPAARRRRPPADYDSPDGVMDAEAMAGKMFNNQEINFGPRTSVPPASGLRTWA